MIPEYFAASTMSSSWLRARTLRWSGSTIIFLAIMRFTRWAPSGDSPRTLQCGAGG